VSNFEKLDAFALAEEAIAQAEQLLVDRYRCDRPQIEQVMQQAKIENLSPWCAANNF
jgi:hypothetical protein